MLNRCLGWVRNLKVSVSFLRTVNWTVVWDIQHISEMFDVILGQTESAALFVSWNKEFVLAAVQCQMKVFAVFVWGSGMSLLS